jgi:hypothetical protein
VTEFIEEILEGRNRSRVDRHYNQQEYNPDLDRPYYDWHC